MIQMSKRMSRRKRKELTTTIGTGKTIKEMKTKEVIERFTHLSKRTGLTERGQKSLRLLKQKLEGEVKKLEREALEEQYPDMSKHRDRIIEINKILDRKIPSKIRGRFVIKGE